MDGKTTPAAPARRGRRWPARAAGVGVVLAAAAWALWAYPFWGWPFRPQGRGRVPVTPAWALECWLWEDDRNDAAAVRELLDGCRAHDIPVRTVLLDSPWSTRYNDFRFDPARYPDPERFVRGLKAEGYRVVLWMTPMVNSRNPDTAVRDASGFHAAARAKGHLAGDGHQVRWWKGTGSFVDYTHPGALEWWHGMQREVLGWGVDGWKLDGADTLFSGPGHLPYQRAHGGVLSTREYMDLYNREEYRNGLLHNPEFVVMTRAVDDRYYPLGHPEGFAPLDAAPVAWVGDRTHQWSSAGGDGGGDDRDAMRRGTSRRDIGFEGALRDIMASARLGYCVVGDDIGGYHGRGPIPPRLYIRWAQFAAFTGFFLNGGHGERRLWKRTPEELSVIRRYAWLHTELVPYLYTHVVRCHEGAPPLLRPEGDRHQYRLGDDLFVAPIFHDSPHVAVDLPPGRWRLLGNDAEVVEGPRTVERDFALDEFPAYVRDGAIVPMDVSRAYTGFGDAASAGFQTWAIWPHGDNAFTAHQTDRSGTTTVRVTEGDALRVEVSGVRRPHLLRIRREARPASVRLDGVGLREGTDWRHDAKDARLWIRNRDGSGGRYEVR